jgi:hypothetical protein
MYSCISWYTYAVNIHTHTHTHTRTHAYFTYIRPHNITSLATSYIMENGMRTRRGRVLLVHICNCVYIEMEIGTLFRHSEEVLLLCNQCYTYGTIELFSGTVSTLYIYGTVQAEWHLTRSLSTRLSSSVYRALIIIIIIPCPMG